ncbi:MAG: DUF2950 domain-containing protein [Desulfobacca sp.]|nr:DUF2950 domain-containing protein [Desulfobacca sp.]
MKQCRYRKEKGKIRRLGLLIIAVVLVVVFSRNSALAKPRYQKNYPSPEEAVKAMVEAVKAGNTKLLLKIFGPGSKAIFLSGDLVQDKERLDQFFKHYEEKNRLEEVSEKVLIHVGKDDWPFPIPLVKTEKGWKFDTKAGRQEILARRVGRNELNAIQVCLAYVDAQKEYALRKAREGKGLPEYAQEFSCTPGKQDGLYWESAEGQEPSPMGPLFASAQAEGYGKEPLGVQPTPYHGYVYRILKAQGKNASGGARDYVVEGKMIGGFALIAYPAKYGSSGVMTFIVNQNGMVYQKDLVKNTREEAQAIIVFDPDDSWKRAQN